MKMDRIDRKKSLPLRSPKLSGQKRSVNELIEIMPRMQPDSDSFGKN
jgi:hypothetical protein